MFHLNIKKSQIAQALLSLAIIGTASKVFPNFESLILLTPISLGIIFILFLITEKNKIALKMRGLGSLKKIFNFQFSIFNLILLFGLWSLLSSTWSIYPKETFTRSAYLLFLIVTIFAAVHMIDWEQTKYKFAILLPLKIIVVFTSLISLIFNIPETAWTGGNARGFMGFTSHQNTLGALILFTSPSVIELFWKALRSKGNSQFSNLNSQFLFPFFLLFFSFYLLVLTYSRASITSFLILIIILLLLYATKAALIGGGALIALLLIALVLFPDLRSNIKNLLLKDTGSITDTRTPLWKASYNAALEGGIIGLGYGVSHPEIKSGGVGDHFENGRFVREKGNSILAMIEEVGIIGLILFLFPIILVVKRFIEYFRKNGRRGEWENGGVPKSQSPTLRFSRSPFHPFSFSPLHVPILIAFIFAAAFHAQFEAWWTGTGSPLLMIFLTCLLLIDNLFSNVKTEFRRQNQQLVVIPNAVRNLASEY